VRERSEEDFRRGLKRVLKILHRFTRGTRWRSGLRRSLFMEKVWSGASRSVAESRETKWSGKKLKNPEEKFIWGKELKKAEEVYL